MQGLSQKIDRIASAGQDPEALKQLEGAIVALRGVVSHVASNDALAQLSDEVRALVRQGRPGHATSDAFSAIEQRIAAIADALQQSRGIPVGDAAGLETVVRSLADKIDQLQPPAPTRPRSTIWKTGSCGWSRSSTPPTRASTISARSSAGSPTF